MELRRTAIVKLDVSDRAHNLLQQTVRQFKKATQMVADDGWNGTEENHIVTTKTDLHERTYEQVREATNHLNADLVCAARNRAADALNSALEKRKQGQNPSKPQFTSGSVVYNKNAITYREGHATLATVDGRVTVEYRLPEDDVPPRCYLTDEWQKREATLHYRDNCYYLHIAVIKQTEAESAKPENGTVLGVDLNVDGHIAVTSTGAFFGNADYLNNKRREYEQRRAGLQQTGTRSAYLTLKSIGGRFARWSEEYLHKISKALVEEANIRGCSHIAFEKLTHIRERISNASKFQQWAFRTIQQFTEYKAAEYGIAVETVRPEYTSQRCSHLDCRFVDGRNRHGDEFVCLNCDREYHADYNAAKNIAQNLLQSWHTSGSGGATSQLALKSGKLNMSGAFSPIAV